MESYRCPDDLKSVGIQVLTGEACGLSMRILCDLNEDGIKLWETFTRSKCVADPWNDGKASVMIPTSMFQDLWIFGQVMKGMDMVFLGGYVHSDQWETTEFTVGYHEDDSPIMESYRHPNKSWIPTAFAANKEDDHVKRYIFDEDHFFVSRWFKKSEHPGTGLDNQHMMSGRIR